MKERTDEAPAEEPLKKKPGPLLVVSLTALGVVYGDIGTSPLYAFRECFADPRHPLDVSETNVLGILSLIVWSLVLVISVKYLAYVLRADNEGEGGILALTALAQDPVKGKVARGTILILGMFGAALLYGDGMITPAISVLSAVEGLEVAAPQLDYFVLPLTCLILFGLFMFQRSGTAKVGIVFGPIMLIWFVVLGGLGLHHIIQGPGVLAAVAPTHAITFFV